MRDGTGQKTGGDGRVIKEIGKTLSFPYIIDIG